MTEMVNFLEQIFKPELFDARFTDAYHFTTPAAVSQEGRLQNDTVFAAFARKSAFGGGYTVSSGLLGLITFIDHIKVNGITDEVIDYLFFFKTNQGNRKFSDKYLNQLKKVDCTKIQIDAAPEGSLIFPQEPIYRIRGPKVLAKLLESGAALCMNNGYSAYATVAAMLCESSTKDFGNGSPVAAVSAQGLRRGPGIGAAIESILPLVEGGCTSTSTGTAADLLDIPFVGTMDHQWIMDHDNEFNNNGPTLMELFTLEQKIEAETSDERKAELENELANALKADAFRSYAFTHRDEGTFLLDTYDEVQGLENAITVMKEMRQLGWGQGFRAYGVRYDSGDLAAHSRHALKRYAEEGFVDGLAPQEAKTMSERQILLKSAGCNKGCAAADGLNIYTIYAMREEGCYFTSMGVGTATTHPDPLGHVYKMCMADPAVSDNTYSRCDDEQLKGAMKVISSSPAKSSSPGLLNSKRIYGDDGKLKAIVVYDEVQGLDAESKAVNIRNFDEVVKIDYSKAKNLLVPVYDKDGNKVYNFPTKTHSRTGETIIDALAIGKEVKAQIETLPEGARRIVKPRDVLIKEAMMKEFKKAEKAGLGSFNIDRDAIMASLPPEVEHIPVYFDMNLYQQRVKIQEEHLGKSKASKGVVEYVERFEGGKDVIIPSATALVTGNLTTKGQVAAQARV